MTQAFIFLAPGFEEVEMLTVVDMLRRAKIDIQMVSITDSLQVTGSHNISIIADLCFKDASLDDGQILILPGGMPGTTNLQNFEPLTEKILDYSQKGKLLAAVCAAPTVFSALGLLSGKNATCYPTFADKLDAEYVEQPVVIDGNIITSRGMGTCIDFSAAIIEKLTNQATANEVKEKIIYQTL